MIIKLVGDSYRVIANDKNYIPFSDKHGKSIAAQALNICTSELDSTESRLKLYDGVQCDCFLYGDFAIFIEK